MLAPPTQGTAGGKDAAFWQYRGDDHYGGNPTILPDVMGYTVTSLLLLDQCTSSTGQEKKRLCRCGPSSTATRSGCT